MSTEFLTGVHYPQPFDQWVVELCLGAAREVCILSPRLDSEVFDRGELAAALSALVRSSRQAQVRILVRDARVLVGHGHRLLNLSRRLPSSIHIHTLAEHPAWKGQTVVIRDHTGVMYKPADSDHEGFYEPDSRASTQRHLDLFEDLWQHSGQDTELRSLSL